MSIEIIKRFDISRVFSSFYIRHANECYLFICTQEEEKKNE